MESPFLMTDEQAEKGAREMIARLDDDHRKCQERFARDYERYKAMNALDSDSFKQIARDFDAERAYITKMRNSVVSALTAPRLLKLEPIIITNPLNLDSISQA